MKRITLKKYEEILMRYSEWREESYITIRPVSSPRDVIVFHGPPQAAGDWALFVDTLWMKSTHWERGEPTYCNYYQKIFDYLRNAGTMVPTIKVTPDTWTVYTPFTIPFYTPFDVFTEEEIRGGLILGDERWNQADWNKYWEKKLRRVSAKLSERLKIIITKENKWYGNKKS